MAYTSDSIESLAFPYSVRANSSQYIGGTDEQGVWNVTREPLDNAADEAMAGRNDTIILGFDKDGSYWIQDSGSGIPQGVKTQIIEVSGKKVKSQMQTMQAVFGVLHTSGKYRDAAYKVSIGSHGIGAKGTNATAEFFDVVTCFEGKWYSIKFKRGELVQAVKPTSAPMGPLGRMKRGTLIHFKPDPKIFSVTKFRPIMAMEWASIMAYMNPGLKITLVAPTGKTKTYLSKLGLKEYLTDRLAERKATAEADVFEYHSALADVFIAFSSLDECDLRGYTNGLHNAMGGYHVDSVSRALFTAISPYRSKKQDFTRREFDEGLLGIVNAKLHKASFSSQDKTKLTDSRMAAEFEKVVTEAAVLFFKSNKALAMRLCTKAGKLAELKTKFKASKAVLSKVNALKRSGLPPNYAPASREYKIKDRELFIVEGDSAAGGFRKVRGKHQALLPLSGKIKNVLKASGIKGLESEAIISIMVAIGFDPKAENSIAKLQFGKIVCLADADSDGGHINSLLLTLFYRIIPDAFTEGLVYIADMPEYMASPKGRLIVGSSPDEVKDKLKKEGLKASIKHIKGWGEVDPQVLKILAVENTRRLLRVKPITKEDCVLFEKIMANDVAARRDALDIKEEQHHG